MSSRRLLIVIGLLTGFLSIALLQRSPKSISVQKYVAVDTINEYSADKGPANYAIISEGVGNSVKNQENADIKDTLFVKKIISGTELCSISADGFSIDIPIGAVKSEKEITIRGLRYEDIHTLDASIINVTSNYAGYRCLPHGKFEKDLQLSIGYDTSLIPEGYYPTDIRTFFYDEEKQQWENLSIDSIDFEKHIIISKTDHFTDFINGILKQPEIPDADLYAPTSIRNLEYANPLEGMNIMEPPTANNSGCCSMNFPIEVPAGRNGMTPQISISYNSDVKDGIMGPGWSLNIPSITVDTRWGVPPYDAAVESESYLVNGEAIVEAIITDGEVSRSKPLYVENGRERNVSGFKNYAYLTEGKFDSITRIGTSPHNYWWEIIDRNGMQYIFGDSEQENLSEFQYSLAENNYNRNIAMWWLAKVKDLHGNTIYYSYDIGNNPAENNQEPESRYIRINEIRYTAYDTPRYSEEASYIITFEYEESPNVAQLSGMYGFLTSDQKLLSKIKIKYNNNFVKCYKFKYIEGALSKKVLNAIAEITNERLENEEIDCSNNIQKQGFYVHCFDYYTEDAIYFEQGNSINIPTGESVNVLGYNVAGESNISKNTSYSIAGGGSACAGYNDGALAIKTNTLGVNYHYTFDINNQKAQLIDLNGDGIVDRVEKTVNNNVRFYKGKWCNGSHIEFEPYVALPTLTKLSKSSSQTHSVGSEMLIGLGSISGMLGYSFSRMKTINSCYFMDVNGDGFVDYVSDNDVLINFPDEYGIPQFNSMNSIPATVGAMEIAYDNCYSFAYSGEINIEEPEADASELKRDPVILWRSPASCTYNLEFEIANPKYTNNPLIFEGITIYDTDSTTIINKDYKKNCTAHIEPDALHPINSATTYIPKGGHVLFHLRPEYEQVIDIYDDFYINIEAQTLPEGFNNYCSNTSLLNFTDANKKELFHYTYGNDAVIQDGMPFNSAYNGKIKWSANLNIGHQMSDTLTYSVIHNVYHQNGDSYYYEPHVVGPYRISANEFATCEITSNDYTYDDNENEYIYTNYAHDSLLVSERDQLYFRLEANSNVDWSRISFTSSVKYGEGIEDTATYYPSLDMSIYSRQISMSHPVCYGEGSYTVTPDANSIVYIDTDNNSYSIMEFLNTYTNAEVYLTVKSLNKIIAKKKLVTGNETLNFDIEPNGNTIYFDYTVNGEVNLPESEILKVNNCKVKFYTNSNNYYSLEAGLFAKYSESNRIFGNLYRGWGQFSYRDNTITSSEEYPYAPIPFRELHMEIPMTPEDIQAVGNGQDQNFNYLVNSSTPHNTSYEQALENYINNEMGVELNPMFEPMHVDVLKKAWIDPFNSAFIKRTSIGSGNGMQEIVYAFSEFQNNSNGIAEYGDNLPNFNNSLGERRFPIINKVSKSNSNSFSAAAGVGPVDLGYNHTKTETYGLRDMMDMNGDGFPDIISTNKIQYTLPNGDMSDNIFTFSGNQDVYTNYNKGKTNGVSTSFKPHILKEKGTNYKSTEKNINSTASLGLSGSGSENNVLKNYIDINSDGLPDIVTLNPLTRTEYEICVEYNLGYKFTNTYTIGTITTISRNVSSSEGIGLPLYFNISNYSISGGANANNNESKDMTTMMDINSDGLIDIVTVSRNNLFVYLNNGRGFDSGIRINARTESLSKNKTFNISANGSGSFGFPIMFVKIVASLYADFSYSISNEKLRLMDVNGDGAIDILKIDEDNNNINTIYGIPQKHNLLKKVTTPALGEYEMAYSMLHPDADNPNHKWIMTGLKMRDNDGNFADGHDSIQYQFAYSGMKYHRIERESYGFAEVITKTVDDWSSASAIVLRLQIESFHTENGQLHGLKYRDEILDANENIQTRTDYNWTLNDLNTGAVAENPECGDGRELYPRLESEQTTVFDANQQNTLTSKRSYIYTRYGNLSKYISKYKHNDWVTAEMEYSADRSRHLLNLLTELEVKSADNQIIRKITREYNSYGDITKVINYLSNNAQDTCATDYQYDIYGNLTKVTYPVNKENQRAFYQFTYDDASHTYLSSVTDVFGCSTQLLNYDYRFGKPRSVVAQNGTETQYTYFSDGKLKTVKAPTDLVYSARFEYWSLLNNLSKTRWARVIHHDTINEGNTFITQTVCDGFGRTVQTARKSVIGGVEKFVASGKNVYDAYGRVVESYQPAEVSGNTGAGFLHSSFENPTTYTYDCMDRVLTTVTPDNKTITKSYNVSIDALGDSAILVTTTYPLNRTHMSYTDSRGLQTTATTMGETDDIITTFAYSPIGELLTSTDPEGYTTTYEYDMLGHIVHRSHPDAGDTYFRYDKAGNIISKKTQKLFNTNDSIKYNYNFSRLMSIEYPHNPQMNVYYEYGTSGLSRGLVTKRQDGVCIQSYTYNALGDVVQNIRTFAFNGRPATFRTEWEYDTWGRIIEMTYPDGGSVEYSYDNAGNVSGMSYKVNDIKYDKYGKRTYIEYANGIHTDYTYNELNQQLSRMRSFGANNVVLQNITYTYDDVYNITGIENSSDHPYAYTYQYDRFNRLVSSSGSSIVGNNTPTYNFATSYSPSGKIMNNTLTGNKLVDGQMSNISSTNNYSYGTQHPHAATSIGSAPSFAISYQWDANGNIEKSIGLRQYDTRVHYFNEDNRLAAISDHLVDDNHINFNNTISGPVAAYLYDADGERVWKFTGTATATYSSGQIVSSSLELDKTFYPTQHVTIDNNRLYKHYFIGGERICTEVTMWNALPILQGNHVGVIHGNASQFVAGLGEQVRRALDSVGYNGDIAYNQGNYSIPGSSQIYYYHYNHQGSVALVTNMVGTLRQHLQYLPYGGIFVDHRTGSYSSTYTFSAKEKDSESGYTYFGARYYSDNIMQWLSVDPMSDERPWISPYNYCQWNPIGRVDTWGMLDDEWSIDKEGKFTKLNDNKHKDANGNEVDKLFNSKGKSIDVRHGILRMGTTNKTGFYRFDFGNSLTDAENFYYFCAQSSDIEWTRAEVKGFGKFVGTDFNKGYTSMPENFEKWYGGHNIIRMSHSHPNGSSGHPSYNVNGQDLGDINNAQNSPYNYIREVYDVQHNRVYEYSRNTSIPRLNEGLGNDMPRYDRMRYINVDYR